MKNSYMGKTTVLVSCANCVGCAFITISHQQMVFLKQTLQAIEELYIPLETCDVSQFAFAAFSRVAAGHKVNSSWGTMRVMRNKQSH